VSATPAGGGTVRARTRRPGVPPTPIAALLAASAVLLTAFAVLLVALAGTARADDTVSLWYFGIDHCPYCAQAEAFLDELERDHPDGLVVERHRVTGDPDARARWQALLAERGHDARAFPTVVLGEQVWVGFDQRVARQVEAAVRAALLGEPVDDAAVGVDEAPSTVVEIPLIGAVDAATRSALGATVLIALVDGINPCSLWVLMVLLAMVVNAGASRGRLALIGAVFLTVTGLIYGAFIAGVFTVLGFVEHLGVIRVGVALIALVVGAINVKDYVAFKRGISLTIPDRAKPRIYRGGRAIRDTDRPLAAVLGTTVAMAAGISVVELPCTAGFPVIWSGILRTQGIDGAAFVGLLAVYLLVYVLDELILFGIILVTLRIEHFQERHGRLLKLIAGTVMLGLGAVLLLAPELMENLLFATLLMTGAVGTALLVDRVHRRRSKVDAAP
jgi:glutaredoxin